MALVVDASTPVAVTGNPGTLTTASFTPPAGSMLYICIGINSSGATNSSLVNSITGVTDNRGAHLTYTQRGIFGNTGLNNDAIAYLYTAPVTTSVAMTVSATQQNTAGTSAQALLRVLVVTGADSAPVGTIGGGRGLATNITAASARYLATRGGSWGWLIAADWAQKGVPTVPADETVDAQYDSAGEDSYAVIKKATTSASAGLEVVMSTISPNSAAQIAYLYFEMLPATVAPSGNSVPSGSALTTPAFTAKYLFFDTGDYSPGI